MKYISYFLWWIGCVFAVSFYYNAFWDIFYAVWFQEHESLIYGFDPAGLPPLNWKINLLIWLSGIVIMGFVFGLIMDGVAKKHYRKRKHMPVLCIVANQLFAMAVYLIVGHISNYWEKIYYMPRFLIKICEEMLSLSISPYQESSYLFWFTFIHMMIFAALSTFFYFEERRKQEWIIKREEEYRKERENQN